VLPWKTASGFAFDQASWDDYVACFRDPASIHAGCEDYRAAWHVDRLLDLADKGHHKLSSPLLVLWGKHGELARTDPIATWQAWAGQVTGHMVATGHFIPEEASEEVVAKFRAFFG